MRRALFMLLVLGGPAFAQVEEERPNLFERSLESFLRDLLGELEPAIREMEPALRELRETIENFDDYHPPEVLPNGDIILRRKTPLDPPPEAPPEPEVDEPIDI